MALILDPNGNPAGGGTAKDAAPGTHGPNSGGHGADGDLIKDTTLETFTKDVIEASMDVPVLVDFWAPWCGPCKQLMPALEKNVKNAGGLVRLVKINVDENPEIAQQLRVQSVPTVYAFVGGRPVDAFNGAVSDSQIKSFIDRLTGDAKAPLDAAMDEAEAMLAEGDADSALQVFAGIQSQDPVHAGAIGGMIRAHLALNQMDQAQALADSLPADLKAKTEIAAALSALDLAGQGTAEEGETAELRQAVADNPNNHQARFDLATALYGSGASEEAIDELLELVRRDRKWDDEAARKQLVKIFDALGPTHELTVDGRRRLSSVLFS